MLAPANFTMYSIGKQNKNSDIDILIKISNKYDLFHLVELKRVLEKVVKKEVDLVEYDCINPLMVEQVKKEEIRII